MEVKEYFSHDYNARNDWKIKRLIAACGMEGYGIYWAIVENLYINNNIYPFDIESISYELRADKTKINQIICDFELFTILDNNEFFCCTSIEKRLDKRAEKSEKARASAQKRWTGNASAMQTQYIGNAIKEKNSKEKNSKEKVLNITTSFKNWSIDDLKNSMHEVYKKGEVNMSRDEYLNFLSYWTEKTSSGKFRFQLEKAWDTNLRLQRWAKNNDKVNSKQSNETNLKNSLNNTLTKIINDEY